MYCNSLDTLYITRDRDFSKFHDILVKCKNIIQPNGFQINEVKRRSKKFEIPPLFIGMEFSMYSNNNSKSLYIKISEISLDEIEIFLSIDFLEIDYLEKITLIIIQSIDLYYLHLYNYDSYAEAKRNSNELSNKLNNIEFRLNNSWRTKLKRIIGIKRSMRSRESIISECIHNFPKQFGSKHKLHYYGGPIIYFGCRSHVDFSKEFIKNFNDAHEIKELHFEVIMLSIYNIGCLDEIEKIRSFRLYFSIDSHNDLNSNISTINNKNNDYIDYNNLPLNRFYLGIFSSDRNSILNELKLQNIKTKIEWNEAHKLSVYNGYLNIPPVMLGWTYIGGEVLSYLMNEKVKYIILSRLSKKFNKAIYYGKLNSSGHHNIILFENGKLISSYYETSEYGKLNHKGQVTVIVNQLIDERKKLPPFGFFKLTEKEEERILNRHIKSSLDKIVSNWSIDFFRVKNLLELEKSDCIIGKIDYKRLE
jgi:hypothetical protein